ncbi:hypothetical protein [Bartonella sp. ML71XJBT]|uniref:hypothetical protein n=1 Tax=Bartonella sp. ML71XJBT TaxID=3019094 RepID=UPI0023602077|nr:hypothetical protein [Bartonella sp. ML71XJBT]
MAEIFEGNIASCRVGDVLGLAYMEAWYVEGGWCLSLETLGVFQHCWILFALFSCGSEE